MAFVIITTEAEGYIKDIHYRAPLIIKNDELNLWLNKNTSMKLVEEILNTNNNKFIIERYVDESKKSDNEQMSMF